MKKYTQTDIVFVVIGVIVGLGVMSLSLKVNTIVSWDRFTEIITFDSWIPAIVGMMICTGIATEVHARNEATRIIKGLHWKRFFIRAIVLAAFPAVILIQDYTPGWHMLWLYLINGFWFGLWFDPRYNVHKSRITGIKFPWWFMGSTAWYDISAGKLNIVKYLIIIEGLGFIGSCYGFFKTI